MTKDIDLSVGTVGDTATKMAGPAKHPIAIVRLTFSLLYCKFNLSSLMMFCFNHFLKTDVQGVFKLKKKHLAHPVQLHIFVKDHYQYQIVVVSFCRMVFKLLISQNH